MNSEKIVYFVCIILMLIMGDIIGANLTESFIIYSLLVITFKLIDISDLIHKGNIINILKSEDNLRERLRMLESEE